MVRIVTGCIIHCSDCDADINVDAEAFDCENELIEDHDDGMGGEYEWYFTACISCVNCGKQIELSFSVFEYPVGAIECVTVNQTTGCTVTQMPRFEAEIEADEAEIEADD